MLKNVTDTVFYVGVDDKNIDLFENQYIVPNGIAYNSYVIMDEKIADRKSTRLNSSHNA